MSCILAMLLSSMFCILAMQLSLPCSYPACCHAVTQHVLHPCHAVTQHVLHPCHALTQHVLHPCHAVTIAQHVLHPGHAMIQHAKVYGLSAMPGADDSTLSTAGGEHPNVDPPFVTTLRTGIASCVFDCPCSARRVMLCSWIRIRSALMH
jgi:hypothetical protein